MNILLFGATGSAGGSVLKACLASNAVNEVHVIARRTPLHTHDKLRVHLHHNYLNYAAVADAFENIHACFFCLGISVAGVSGEAEYRTITHDYAVAAARMLKLSSPRASFHYLSAQGADPKSLFMWARVKGQTDEELMDFIDAVCWRPSAIDGEPSDNAPRVYKIFRPYFRVFKPFRSLYVSGEDLGNAMIHAAAAGIRRRVIPNVEIRDVAERATALLLRPEY
jgi:uncharacterized protein YbjT (DUF2867 family)